MSNLLYASVIILATILIYLLARKIYFKWKTPLLLPVTVTTVVIIVLLEIFQLSYETYMHGGKWIMELLGPAVVALAYPLYQHRKTLKQLYLPIIVGAFVGSIVGIVSGVGLAILANIDAVLISSLGPKSVTTPVAMELAKSTGGVNFLAAVFVMIAGIGGTMLSATVFKYGKINHPVGRGLGIGSASHAIGTSKALENSKFEGSISTIAMILSAFFVSIMLPPILLWWL